MVRGAASLGFMDRSERNLASAQRSELLELAPEDVGHGQQAVRKRRLRCRLNMTVALESSGAPTHQQRGDVEPRMDVRLAHAAAEQYERMIQERPIAVRHGA